MAERGLFPVAYNSCRRSLRQCAVYHSTGVWAACKGQMNLDPTAGAEKRTWEQGMNRHTLGRDDYAHTKERDKRDGQGVRLYIDSVAAMASTDLEKQKLRLQLVRQLQQSRKAREAAPLESPTVRLPVTPTYALAHHPFRKIQIPSSPCLPVSLEARMGILV